MRTVVYAKLAEDTVDVVEALIVPVVALLSGAIVHREPLGLVQWRCSTGDGAGDELKP
ncbi:hypothetical protein [Piscinibacter sp.]|uniref:hypothetical protein n=1 Tax=Piscinibacter sp. TaxID=1903157 RepID=UPI002CD595F7|nr:hypothetical protein [Albitalea sp.]HUG26478.1 hypothetical protein [Albitalea sp.]